MYKILKNKTSLSLAILLTMIFISPWLLKPMHVLLHNDAPHFKKSTTHPDLIQKEKDCPACDFHFFVFGIDYPTSYKIVEYLIFCTKNDYIVQQYVTEKLQFRLGRAPPF